MDPLRIVEGLAAVVAAGIAIELLARVWIRRHRVYYVLPPGARRLVGPDPATHPQLERACRFEVNGDGERGAPFPRGTPGGFRILMAGGSAVESYLNDQDTSWPGVVESRLNAPAARAVLGASRVHVGSVARSGVDARVLALILERILPRYRDLDLLVIMVGASDVLRWLEAGAPADRPADPAPITSFFVEHPDLTFGWRPRRLAVVELLKRAMRRLPRGVEVQNNMAKWIGRARAGRLAATAFRTGMPDSTAMLATFDEWFRRCLTLGNRYARRTIVVRQPWFEKRPYTPEERALLWNGSVGSAFQGKATDYFSDEVLWEMMRRMDARAAAISDEYGVPHVDLMPRLEMSGATFFDHFHFTRAGSAAVGEVVAAQIIATTPRGAAGAPGGTPASR